MNQFVQIDVSTQGENYLFWLYISYFGYTCQATVQTYYKGSKVRVIFNAGTNLDKYKVNIEVYYQTFTSLRLDSENHSPLKGTEGNRRMIILQVYVQFILYINIFHIRSTYFIEIFPHFLIYLNPNNTILILCHSVIKLYGILYTRFLFENIISFFLSYFFKAYRQKIIKRPHIIGIT